MRKQTAAISEMITAISKASDRYGNKLIEFMERYNLYNLTEATEEMLQEFIKREEIKL